MGFFSNIANKVKNVAKGVKRGFTNVVKGVKKTAMNVVKGVKRGAKFLGDIKWSDFKKPEVWKKAIIKNEENYKKLVGMLGKIDPSAKKLGGFSPLQTVGEIVGALPLATAYFMRASVDEKRQKRLREGNPDEILDAGISGLSFVPFGYVANKIKGGKTALKQLVKNARFAR